jgi:hypothetical protein
MDCPTCGKSLSTERGMRQHHTKVHGDPLPNRTCKDCGAEFYDPKARRSYCEGCYSESGAKNGNYRDATEITDCKRCGACFEYYPSNKDGVYCSECVSGADGLLPENPSSREIRVAVRCRNCDATLHRRRSEVEDSERGAFCNLECYGEWLSNEVIGEAHHQWEGGEINYGTKWWRIRREALERDGYTCQRCGKDAEEIGRNPDVHHIEPVRSFENAEEAHSLDNVVSLCRSCHRLVEEGASISGTN